MSGSVLLDTNAVIAIFANTEGIRAVIATHKCLIPSIVVGELLYGAERSANASNNIRRVNEFCDKVTVIACDRDTASRYGVLKNQLRTAGTPIPENDLWIAAIAMQHRLPIMSRDGHFDNVREVTRTAW